MEPIANVYYQMEHLVSNTLLLCFRLKGLEMMLHAPRKDIVATNCKFNYTEVVQYYLLSNTHVELYVLKQEWR